MNLVSFSLYGTKPKYLVGAIRNAMDVPKFYPDFKAVFYCYDDVPDEVVVQLRSLGAIIERWTKKWPRIYMIERHMAAESGGVVLVRDADSRISDREARAVEAWLSSDKKAHVMRDFPFHTNRMMGGMWGVRGKLEIRRQFHQWCAGRNFPKSTWFGLDQKFLCERVFPQIQHSVLEHDDFNKFPGAVNFPTMPLADGSFVGEIWDENDKPVQSDRDVCYEARKNL
jgi:hypothetical protein